MGLFSDAKDRAQAAACVRCPQTFCDVCKKVYAPPHTTTCVKCVVDLELAVDDLIEWVRERDE